MTASRPDMSRRSRHPVEVWLVGVGGLACLGILAGDFLVPAGVAGGVLYALVVLIGLWISVRPYVLLAAVVGTVFTILGYVLSPSVSAPWVEVSNRGLALFAIWLTYGAVRSRVAATERLVRTTERLEEAREYLENLFESARAPILIWDQELRITRYNSAFRLLTGHSDDAIVGQSLGVLFPADSRDKSVASILHASSNGLGEPPEIPILRKDGTVRIVLWSSGEIHSSTDKAAVVATIAQGQDITERKHAQQMKEDFVSFVSHQLRTPLSGMRWLLELAEQDDGVPAETASFVTDARVSAERLIALVNDLLAVSRLEGGRLALNAEVVNLAELTTRAVSELAPTIEEKRLQVSVSDVAEGPFVHADPSLLREVVQNLLTNATQYTPDGGSVTVSLKVGKDIVEWAVRDTGIGITPDAQAHLFEKFYRAENASAMRTEGTGLGLYLARLIIERSGGHVWCESEVGRGSTFTFMLPAGRAREPGEVRGD